MNLPTTQPPTTLSELNAVSDALAREARPSLQEFSHANNARAVFELAVTFVPWLGLLAASYWISPVSTLASIALAAVGGLFWVRLFILQHDCGHGSFLSSARANRVLGAALGVFTLTPFARWKASHAAHHATSGNLAERRWSRDIYLYTVDEYDRAPQWLRSIYRLYRNRFVLFFALAPLVFLIEHRRYTSDETSFTVRSSVWGTNVALLALGSVLFLTLDPVRLLAVLVPFYLLGAAIGVWLFYAQHQFEDAYWAEGENYSHAAASLAGSSVLRLPGWLAWMTAHIGIHHIHHLAPRVASYSLAKCDRNNPQLAIGPQFSLSQALIQARGDLWDPASGKLVTFARAESLP